MAASALYDDRSSQVISASVVLIVLPTLAVILRLLSRWISYAGLWWDDGVAVIAMILAWGPNISNLVAVHYGLGKHINVLPPQTNFVQTKLYYSFEFLYSCAMCTVKYSVILFQHRIFPIARFRRILKYATVFVIALTCSTILVSIFQCIPIHAFWDTYAGELPGGKCVNVKLYLLTSGAFYAVTDFVLLALPIPVLWKLKTERPQKLLLTGIFTMGLM